MKRNFLVVYDYGTGGLWAVIKARSKDEIVAKYPTLTVMEVDDRPRAMSEAEYRDIASRNTFDIDDEPTGLLAIMTDPE